MAQHRGDGGVIRFIPVMERLNELLEQIDRRGYKAYKRLQGDYHFPDYALRIDHVQGDPFADPSRCRVFIEADTLGLDAGLYANPVRRIALEDYLGRVFARALQACVKGDRGSGRSGEMVIARYGQQVLRRNAVLVERGAAQIRFRLALPADGRSVNARQARAMLFEELPQVVRALLHTLQRDPAAARKHVDSVEDQDHLRGQLEKHGLVAFIADGAILPRRSGIDDRPLEEAVAFHAPDSLAIELERLHAGPLRGLGIRQGITLIVGGGYHGKSTLLHALERGVYDHIPGDGRECVVTDPGAFKIRSEDGRAITGVDISPFIGNLPQDKDTRRFSSQNASGSTSQAANIIEALATGVRTLLIDEDTSATNFMIRDRRMQALVAKDKEPITPLVQRVRALYDDYGVSTVLVMGGSGDYFGVAQTVIMMDNYLPRDVTAEAHELALDTVAEEAGPMQIRPHSRVPRAECLNSEVRPGKEKIQAFETRALRYGKQEIDLSRVEQLVDSAQLRAIAYLIRYYARDIKTQEPDLVAGLTKALAAVEREGLDRITPYIVGNLALPRLQELVATVNRMRELTLEGP